MDNFVCEQCECVDVDTSGDSGFICTECRVGEWHHFFAKERYNPAIHTNVVNRTNAIMDDGSEVSLG